MITYVAASQVRVGDVVLSSSSFGSNIVFGATVARVSEYDEMTYVEDSEGFTVPYDMVETLTVIRKASAFAIAGHHAGKCVGVYHPAPQRPRP